MRRSRHAFRSRGLAVAAPGGATARQAEAGTHPRDAPCAETGVGDFGWRLSLLGHQRLGRGAAETARAASSRKRWVAAMRSCARSRVDRRRSPSAPAIPGLAILRPKRGAAGSRNVVGKRWNAGRDATRVNVVGSALVAVGPRDPLAQVERVWKRRPGRRIVEDAPSLDRRAA